jgi:DNA-binding LytR/AlgR family response regulator
MSRLNTDIIAQKKLKLNKLSIPTTEGYELVDTMDIDFLEAEINYTHIHLVNNRKITSSKNLGYYEVELNAEPFLRIHNSTIINLSKVKSYIRGDDGWVILHSGKTLKVSKSKKDDLLLFFQGKKTG